MALDLKKVSKISQRYRDIVNGYIKEVQQLFPTANAYYNIVDLIQHCILLYFYQQFESKILTDDEQEIFRNLFIDNDKAIIDESWKLIYRRSKNG